MKYVSSTEFQKCFRKYMKLAQKETLIITYRNKPIFETHPVSERIKDMESIFNVLPSNVSTDDIDRE